VLGKQLGSYSTVTITLQVLPVDIAQ